MSRARSNGALGLLAAGFLASAALRAGEVVAALPVEDGFGGPVPEIRQAPAPAETSAAETPEALIAELQARRDGLAAREAELETRAQTLEAMEARLETRLKALEAAQERLESTAVLVDDAAERDVRHLAEMYASMKPKDAAEIFDKMPPSFAAGFLGSMESVQAALIMANMGADQAYAVSLLLAGRNVGREGAAPPSTAR